MKRKKRIAIIGAGFSGLSAAAYAAQQGHEVHVYEMHNQPGGRARQFSTPEGFVFDMGPSWYWMPDIIENFFADFGTKSADFYELKSLDPQFEMLFADGKMDVPASYDQLRILFERIEPGAAVQLDKFMDAAQYKYEVGMQEFVYKPCHHWGEFVSGKILKSALKLDLLSDFRSYVAKYFKDIRLRSLMEFPVIFLGASPKAIPALYSLMNYGGYVLGTKYPIGGFYKLVLAMQKVAEDQGANFHFSHHVNEILTANNRVAGLKINGLPEYFDAVIASSDYHHTETLLPRQHRNYDQKYWESKTFAPSCLIYYLGFNTKIPKLQHHTLFFENDLDGHIHDIYEDKKWPEKPLFYACCPSKTDSTVAPEGMENVFLLMPLATGLHDTPELREQYLVQMLKRLEVHTEIQDLSSQIIYKRDYAVNDFVKDYHAYGGNAYGLANTLAQTAVWKPKMRNKKLANLFYTGQLTVPGPGVPPSIISGKIVAQEIPKLKTVNFYEAPI